MALTDSNVSRPFPVPLAAALSPGLVRLPEIHLEISETAALSRFLQGAVSAGAALTLCGIVAVMFIGGGGLKQQFAWALLVLAGVTAMLRASIRAMGQALDRAPLRQSARNLRAILLYAGFAWGAGAFLLLGNDPVPIAGLCFAVLPSLLMALLLKDCAAAWRFIAPVTALSAAAIVLEPWGDAPVALLMLLAVQGAIAAGLALSGRTPQPPAGFSLR
jgi:hypothetical protein